VVRVSLLIAICLVPPAGAAPASGKIGCASCHREEARTQPKTAMGIAIELPAAQALLKEHPKLTFEAYGYKYVIERKDGVSTYTVGDGAGSLSLPIQYAFGVYSQTFVLEYGGRYYESLVSYYQGVGGLAITMGSERLRPRNLVEAMGRLVSNEEIVSCFGCHSSGGTNDGKLTLDTLRPGLDCEHCHTGANAHMEAISQGKQAPFPQKLGGMAAEDMSTFCGSCHRTWSAAVRLHAWGELNVRFQPYRLANSKCFLGNDKRIGCTACHNPHADPVRDDSSYDRNCLSCHRKTAAAVTQKSCPVADSKCTSCHMPKIELPGSHSVFTDHQIRIVRAGDRYPN
jgi:Cytochrome c554 and c-prime